MIGARSPSPSNPRKPPVPDRLSVLIAGDVPASHSEAYLHQETTRRLLKTHSESTWLQ